jgi:formylglycine-generating enzyme required for sulfatase activity
VRSLAALCLLTAPALGGVPDYDFGWSVIGDPGNRPATVDEVPGLWNGTGGRTVGAVDYSFRMATTEVTASQFSEFLNAYRPHTTFSVFSIQLTGLDVAYDFDNETFVSFSGIDGIAARVTWRMAARYTNWLHNGKGTEASDFETGVYDTQTFSFNADGTFNDQLTHHADADFWLPTSNEWIKAAHWDPEKDNGEGGYWYYPHGSDEVPIYAPPGEGGESSGGLFDLYPVASYAAQGPWGLYDMSGSATEWLETANSTRTLRLYDGSSSGTLTDSDFFDAIDGRGSGFVHASYSGFRVASVVPTPATLLLPLAALLTLTPRRRPCAASC